jgi:uncharacterized membrane protein
MGNIVSSPIGLLHLIFSITALISGLYVLLARKGTKAHKKTGYFYAFSMAILNLTAFMIYELYGKFGIFHVMAIVSCLTLFAGLYPVIRKTKPDYLIQHFYFMYWSVIGLYCAFVAEVFSRLPKIVLTPTGEPMLIFYKFVGLGTALVMLIGTVFYIKYKPVWRKQYSSYNNFNATAQDSEAISRPSK